jgi:hypothetical protein
MCKNILPPRIQACVDIVILFIILLFISVFIDARLIFWDTILTGGDSASWYQVAVHLKETLIPNFRLYGWDMSNFCGYPNFNFYFIPPFLIAVLISYIGIPLTIGLKIVMAAGWYMLPVSVYFGLRLMAYRFPSPIIGASASLLFLFNETYTMFGGNILSTVAGEFCYMFAFSLLPYFMGSMIKGLSNDRRIILNGLLLGLIGLSHLFVFIPAMSIMLYGFFSKKRTVYFLQVGAVGFGAMAFWILPLIAWRHPYTVPVYMIWQSFVSIKLTLIALSVLSVILFPMLVFQIIPVPHQSGRHPYSLMQKLLVVFSVLCLGIIITLIHYGFFHSVGQELEFFSLSKKTGWLFLACFTFWLVFIVFLTPMGKSACSQFCRNPKDIGVYFWMIGVCVTMYFSAHFLKIPDIRFFPPILLVIIIIVFSVYVGRYVSFLSWGPQLFSTLFILISIVTSIVLQEKNVRNWYSDTFKGYAHTRGFEYFKQLTQYLKTENSLNAPRVAYEKCSRYGPYGGDRVFESLNLFSGRQTLEGIHYSSSLASKFMTFLQTEFSSEIKTPTPFILSQIKPEVLAIHMHLYNISQLILLTPRVKKIFKKSPQYIHEKDIGQFSIFRLKQEPPGYISALTDPPILYTKDDWLDQFYNQWLKKTAENSGMYFVPSRFVTHPEDRAVFQKKTAALTVNPSFFKNKYHCHAEIQSHLSHLKIKFRTSAVGVPHLIRISYFPNWKVTGAHGVYPVSPHFMMVIPRSNEITLTYSRCIWEKIGGCLTGFTWVSLLLTGLWKKNPMLRAFNKIAILFKQPIDHCRPALYGTIILMCVVFSMLGIIKRNLPVRMYQEGNALYKQGIHLKKKMLLKEADHKFIEAIEQMHPLLRQAEKYDHQDVINCYLITAKCYSELNKHQKAHEQYDRIIHDYPYSRYVAESFVEKSRLCRKYRDFNLKTGLRLKKTDNGFLNRALKQTQESIDYLKRAIALDPYSDWAMTAKNELEDEMGVKRVKRRLEL